MVLAENLRRRRKGKVGRSWYVDETYIRPIEALAAHPQSRDNPQHPDDGPSVRQWPKPGRSRGAKPDIACESGDVRTPPILTEVQCAAVQKHIADGASFAELAKRYSTSWQTIMRVRGAARGDGIPMRTEGGMLP